MPFNTEMTIQGIYRSHSDSGDPSTMELHLHCLRVLRWTQHGILPPKEDEPIGPSRFSQLGFSFRHLSEIRHQIWIYIASFNFPLSICSFLYLQIKSFLFDFAAENPAPVCPSIILVANIKFVQKIVDDYSPPHLAFMLPRQLAASAFANGNLILDTSTEGPEGDSNGFVDETFVHEEGRGSAVADGHAFLAEALIPGISAELDQDINAGIDVQKRIKLGKWLTEEEEEERNCSVCLDEFSEGEEVMTMECKHTYHETCILTWFMKNPTCPFCRRLI